MPVSITEDIKSVSDLKKNMRQIFEQLHRTGRPVIVTVNGRPDVVLMDSAAFEKTLKALNMAALLAEGEADVRSGRTRSARDFLKEFRHAKKISR